MVAKCLTYDKKNYRIILNRVTAILCDTVVY